MLTESKTIVSAFVLNRGDETARLQLGQSYIYIGDDGAEYSATNPRCSQPIFDTGFYKLTSPTKGRYISIRKDGPNSLGNYILSLYEFRVYQTPNLLIELQGQV